MNKKVNKPQKIIIPKVGQVIHLSSNSKEKRIVIPEPRFDFREAKPENALFWTMTIGGRDQGEVGYFYDDGTDYPIVCKVKIAPV